MEIMLFVFNLIFLLVSSYYLVSIIKENKVSINLLYLILIVFSQIIISIELLSLFNILTAINMQILQFIFFIVISLAWVFLGKPKALIIDFQSIKSIFTNIKKDKILSILFVGFCFSSLVSLYLGLSLGTNIDDNLAYHLPRVFQWIQNQSIVHFQTNEVRQIQFPINSELLYLWSIIQIKSDFLINLLEYLSYFLSLFVLYNFLDLLKINYKQIIWAVFMFASLPLVIIESSSLQTNLLVGCLIFIGFYLFLYSAFDNKKIPLVFSAIAVDIALGVKTTAWFALLILVLMILLVSVKVNKKGFYKNLSIYLFLLLSFFVPLALFNYFLNWIDFHNPMGISSFVDAHRNTHIQGVFSSGIRYTISLIDFSGINQAKVFSPYIINTKNLLLNMLHINQNAGLILNADIKKANTIIHEQKSLFGLIGFFILLPYSVRSLYFLICNKDNKHFFVNICGIFLILYIFILSVFMNYMTEMNRYLVTAVIMSSPLFIFTYFEKLNAAKIALTIIMLFNFFVIPLNIVSRPFYEVLKSQLKNGYAYTRNDLMYKCTFNTKIYRPEKNLTDEAKKIIPDNSVIGIIVDFDENLYSIYTLNKKYKIIIINGLYMDKEKLLKNDYLITNVDKQVSTLYKPFKVIPSNCNYKFLKYGIKNHLECSIDKKLINDSFDRIKIVKYDNVVKYFIYKRKK